MRRRLTAVLLIVSLGLVGCNHSKQSRPDTIWSRSSVTLIPPIAVERDYDQRPFDLELALRSLSARDALLARAGRPRATAASRGAKRSRIGACSLDYIKARESGGNYGAVNPNGHYGAWQFDYKPGSKANGTPNDTWEGAAIRAGHGDYANTRPDQAPAEVQDAAAAQLYSERGSQPWSVC